MRNSKPKLSRKNWWKMTEAEREAEFNEIDAMGEIPISATRQPTEAEVAAVLRKPTRGRPRLGVGARHVNITVNPALLKRADATARQRGMSRSALIAHALEELLRRAG